MKYMFDKEAVMKKTLALVLVFCLVGVGLYWYFYHMGVKEEVDRTLDASVFWDDSTELTSSRV